MSLFSGVENFTPALEGQKIAIGAGSAMRQGLQGIEEIGKEEKMKRWLDMFSNALNSDFSRRKGNAYDASKVAGPDDFGTLPSTSSNQDYGGLEG